MLKIRLGALPLIEVKTPLGTVPVTSVCRSSQCGKIAKLARVSGRQVLLNDASAVWKSS